MKHLVIGAGNLGIDLYKQIVSSGDEAVICSRSNGYDLEDTKKHDELIQYAKGFDAVWYCVGFGSIREAIYEPSKASLLYVEIPNLLIKYCPYVILFSTDYVADERKPLDNNSQTEKHKSHYAHLKWRMECGVNGAENATAIRVGSLYGLHKPMSTFPGKLLKNAFHKREINLPMNLVTPTSTSWLAELLVHNLDRIYKNPEEMNVHHAAPHGFVTVREWGSMILGRSLDGDRVFFDQDRPLLSCLGTSFTSHDTHWLSRWHGEWNMSLRDKILKNFM
jgi:dTDP-4-dehydrorhamnose reductase